VFRDRDLACVDVAQNVPPCGSFCERRIANASNKGRTAMSSSALASSAPCRGEENLHCFKIVKIGEVGVREGTLCESR
jgi:hypothetical protein